MLCTHGLESCAICSPLRISVTPSQPIHSYPPHDHQSSPPFIGTSNYVYSPTGDLQQSPTPPNSYQQYGSHGYQRYHPSVGSPWGGYFPAAIPDVQYSPAGSPSSSPPKLMRHMTCYFWHRGSCKHSDDACLYAHQEFVPPRIAGPPLVKEPGMPAVAGRNAMREPSVYTDWSKVHATAAGLAVESRSQPKTSPSYNQQTWGFHPKREAGRSEEGELYEGEEASLPMNTNLYINMPSSPPQKAVKLYTSSAHEDPKANTPLEEELAENQAMKGAISDLCQVIAILTKDQPALMKKQAQAHEEILRQVLTLPQEEQGRFTRPVAHGTQTLVEIAVGSSKVTDMIDDVRNRLVDANLGSLLIPMDRKFCSPTTEAEEE